MSHLSFSFFGGGVVGVGGGGGGRGWGGLFLFHLIFSLSLTLIIGMYYCLNYASLLLHLITTHLVSHLSLSSIIFSIPTLIIDIFHCLNYISLVLHLIITHLVNIIYDYIIYVLGNYYDLYISLILY